MASSELTSRSFLTWLKNCPRVGLAAADWFWVSVWVWCCGEFDFGSAVGADIQRGNGG
jgi:hypothetical protein